MKENTGKPFPPEMASFLTTEHFTLQSARSQTISESNARLGGYLTLLSSTIVALAFISQVAGSTEILLVAALVLLPMDLFLGFVTVIRLAQLAIANIVYLAGMNRIRGYFVEAAPETAGFLVMPHVENEDSLRTGMFITQGIGEQFSSMSMIIIVLNSILAGALAGIIAFAWIRLTPASSYFAAAAGAILAFIFHAVFTQRYALKVLQTTDLNKEIFSA